MLKVIPTELHEVLILEYEPKDDARGPVYNFPRRIKMLRCLKIATATLYSDADSLALQKEMQIKTGVTPSRYRRKDARSFNA